MNSPYTCFGWILMTLCGMLAGCSEHAATGAMPPPLVKVMTVEARDVPTQYEFVGQTQGSRAVEVRAQVSGILKSRIYDEGEIVDQGQVLFEIEPDSYKAALEQAQGGMAQAEARYVQASQDLARVIPLYAKNAVSQRDRDVAQATFDGAKADMESAKASVEEARIKLGYAQVVSPIRGYAGKEKRTVGNLISGGASPEALLTVVNQVDPIYVNFAMPSPFVMRMRTLMQSGRMTVEHPQAFITLADKSRYSVPGKVTFVDRAVNTGTSEVSARAEFANNDLFMLPGQFVRITLAGSVLHKAILVPQRAIVQTQNGPVVVVVSKDNKAEMRPIVLSDNINDSYLLEKGLVSGERIVVEGTNKAVPGQPVRVVELEQEKKIGEALLPQTPPAGA